MSAIATFLPHTYIEINRGKWSLRLVLATFVFVLYRITILAVTFLVQYIYSTLDRLNEYISAERIFLTLLSAGILMIPSFPVHDVFLVCWVKWYDH